MGMRKVYDLVSVCGKYQDSQTGEEKSRYSNHGCIMKDDESGRIAVKLENMPLPQIGKDGFPSIWLSAFSSSKNNQQGGQSRGNPNARVSNRQHPPQTRYQHNDDPPPSDNGNFDDGQEDDPIPF